MTNVKMKLELLEFAKGLNINPNDEMFSIVIKSGNLYEFIDLLIDTQGTGTEFSPFDGVYTQYDFLNAAQKGKFSEDIIEDLLDIDVINRLEKG